jgi:NTE family protein
MSKLGVVLSGGGARGAYGAGVLQYVFGELGKKHGAARVHAVAGSSVGAVNGVLLASVVDDPADGLDKLCGIWQALELRDVLEFGLRQLRKIPQVFLGGTIPVGLFDAKFLATLIGREVQWRRLAKNLRTGQLHALTVIATHVATGQPTIFVDRTGIGKRGLQGASLPAVSSSVRVRYEPITPHHVLASAAIPMLFPPIRIHGSYYCDGGLRFNTPMSPAIHLGSDRLLVIGSSTASPSESTAESGLREGYVPGAPFLLGKILNAFLIDHIKADLVVLDRVNDLLEDGMRAYGPDFVQKLANIAEKRGAVPRRIIRPLTIHPSQDIGVLAAEYMRHNRGKLHRSFGRAFLSLMDVGEGADADLASYILFDGAYAQELIDLGRRDAAAQHDELVDFLYDGT